MAPRRLHAEDVTGRTVRHSVRKSQAGAPEDAQGRTVRAKRSRAMLADEKVNLESS
jgi:hypothetical protein